MEKSTVSEKKSGDAIVYFTAREINLLKKINLGYGNFGGNAAACDLHINTYRTIIDRGGGRFENIEKIRKILLS